MKKKVKISKRINDVIQKQNEMFASRPNVYEFLQKREIDEATCNDAQEFVVNWIIKYLQVETKRARQLIHILEEDIEQTASRIAYKLDSVFKEFE